MPWGLMLAVVVLAAMAVAIYVSWPLLFGNPSPAEGASTDDEDSVLDQLLAQKDATYSAIKELQFDHAMGILSKQDYQELAARYEDRAVALLKTIEDVSRRGEALSGSAPPPAVAGVLVQTGPKGALPGGNDAAGTAATPRRRRRRDRGAPLEDEIEREVAALRSRPARDRGQDVELERDIEQEIVALRSARRGGATAGWAPAQAEPALPPPGHSCPVCGSPVKRGGAAYCSRCGAALRSACPVCGEPADEGDVFCSGCGTSLVRIQDDAAAETTTGGIYG